jgi:hypothetical protein
MRKNSKALCTSLLFLFSAVAPEAATYGAEPAETASFRHAKAVYTFAIDLSVAPKDFGSITRQQQNAVRILEHALGEGRILGYGNLEYVVHALGDTHRIYWTANSTAELLAIREELMTAGVLSTMQGVAVRYEPRLYMSNYYRWDQGSGANGYSYESIFTLKQNSSPDKLDALVKGFIGPQFDKMVRDGAIQGYMVNVEAAIHTTDMGHARVVFFGGNKDVLDQFIGHSAEYLPQAPFLTAAWDNIVNWMPHYDFFGQTSYKFAKQP